MSCISESLLKTYCRSFPVQKGKLRAVNQLWPLLTNANNLQRVAQLDCGYKMSCDLNHLLQRQYYFFGTYFTEKQTLSDWRQYCQNADIIFDVGANLGIYSLDALAANAAAKIFAFEPTPEIADHFRKTCDLNSIHNIEVVQKAVGSKVKSVCLNFCGGENEGMNFTTQSPHSANTVEVSQTTLDQFCQDNSIKAIDLMKMDVQGNEADVLKGAQDLLERHAIKTLFFEVNPTLMSDGKESCAAANLLRNYGYQFRPAAHPDWPLQTHFEDLLSFSDLVASRQ